MKIKEHLLFLALLVPTIVLLVLAAIIFSQPARGSAWTGAGSDVHTSATHGTQVIGHQRKARYGVTRQPRGDGAADRDG